MSQQAKSSFGQKSLVKGGLPGRGAIVETDLYHSMGASRSPMAATARALSPTRSPTRGFAGTRSVGVGANSLGDNVATTTMASAAAPKPQALSDSDALNRLPENPTAAQKYRLVFDELDLNGSKSISMNNFSRVLKALTIGFTSDTVEDLYHRMDVEKKGAVTYSSFLDWAEKYPNLVNAIYYRSRELIERTRREAAVDSVRDALEATQREERHAHQQWEVANEALKAQQDQYELTKEDHQSKVQAEKDRSAELFEVSCQCEHAKTDRNARDLACQMAKGHERAAYKPVNGIQFVITQVESKVENLEDTVMLAQDRARRLEEELEEANKEIGKLTIELNTVTDDLGELKSREKEFVAVHDGMVRELAKIQGDLKLAEDDLSRLTNQKNAAVKAQQDAVQAIKVVVACVGDGERSLIPIRQRENHHKDLKLAAQQKLNDADSLLRENEADLNMYVAHRNQSELDEYPTMEQEVRLCEQRYNLDERDEHHYDQTSVLINAMNRNDTRSKTRA